MSQLYKKVINAVDKHVPNRFRPIWMHPAGPKTVFFWAPIFKWSLVIAGLNDLKRPADKISINQSLILAVTGTIWSRWAMVIIPKNYTLLSVNVFVAILGSIQAYRAYQYQKANPQ